MEFDFSAQEVTGATRARFTFYDIPGDPAPWVSTRLAGEANRPFFKEVLKRAATNLERLRAGGANPVMLEESREEDRELYPSLVLCDEWGGKVPQPDGSVIDLDELPCTLENRRAFVRALPGWVFDKLRTFAGEPRNFVSGGPSPAQSEAYAGN